VQRLLTKRAEDFETYVEPKLQEAFGSSPHYDTILKLATGSWKFDHEKRIEEVTTEASKLQHLLSDKESLFIMKEVNDIVKNGLGQGERPGNPSGGKVM